MVAPPEKAHTMFAWSHSSIYKEIRTKILKYKFKTSDSAASSLQILTPTASLSPNIDIHILPHPNSHLFHPSQCQSVS